MCECVYRGVDRGRHHHARCLGGHVSPFRQPRLSPYNVAEEKARFRTSQLLNRFFDSFYPPTSYTLARALASDTFVRLLVEATRMCSSNALVDTCREKGRRQQKR